MLIHFRTWIASVAVLLIIVVAAGAGALSLLLRGMEVPDFLSTSIVGAVSALLGLLTLPRGADKS